MPWPAITAKGILLSSCPSVRPCVYICVLKVCEYDILQIVSKNFIKFTRSSATAEIARVGAGGRYAIQGHSRSLMLVPIESPYTSSH